jgi:hypothetical protein
MWQATPGLTESLVRKRGNPQKCLVFVAIASLACAIPPGAGQPDGPGSGQPDPQVWARSHNKSEVDVYLACGDGHAKWVGLVPAKGSAAFKLAAEDTYCPLGLNFLLVRQGRGYWAGPLRPREDAIIELVIEKYAGLSAARLLNE